VGRLGANARQVHLGQLFPTTGRRPDALQHEGSERDRREALDLARLVAARRASAPAPTWSAIFTKAYALVAARTPAPRTSYLTFPRDRFYEHPANVATLNIDRQLANERAVLYAHVANPEALTLQELDEIICYHQVEPVENITSYRNAVRLSRVPWP
jgi:hypothetical protein